MHKYYFRSEINDESIKVNDVFLLKPPSALYEMADKKELLRKIDSRLTAGTQNYSTNLYKNVCLDIH